MEIESYEPYHIGIKLKPGVNIDALKYKLKTILKERKYESVREVATELPIVPSKEVLGAKKGVKIEINFGANALNIIGYNTSDAMEIFKEIVTFLSEINYEPKTIILFFEIIANITLKVEKKPVETLTKSFPINLEIIEDLGKPSIDGLHIKANVPEEENEFVDFVIEPRSTSPTDRFFVRVLCRSKNMEKIENFHNKMEEKVVKIIELMESEKS